MDSKPKGFLNEDNGNWSLGRLLSLVAMLASIWFGHRASTKPVAESAADLQMAAMMAGAAATLKVGQKYAEKPSTPEGGSNVKEN